jgi:hypothetical protein
MGNANLRSDKVLHSKRAMGFEPTTSSLGNPHTVQPKSPERLLQQHFTNKAVGLLAQLYACGHLRENPVFTEVEFATEFVFLSNPP